jgi:hypothetical protein
VDAQADASLARLALGNDLLCGRKRCDTGSGLFGAGHSPGSLCCVRGAIIPETQSTPPQKNAIGVNARIRSSASAIGALHPLQHRVQQVGHYRQLFAVVALVSDESAHQLLSVVSRWLCQRLDYADSGACVEGVRDRQVMNIAHSGLRNLAHVERTTLIG